MKNISEIGFLACAVLFLLAPSVFAEEITDKFKTSDSCYRLDRMIELYLNKGVPRDTKLEMTCDRFRKMEPLIVHKIPGSHDMDALSGLKISSNSGFTGVNVCSPPKTVGLKNPDCFIYGYNSQLLTFLKSSLCHAGYQLTPSAYAMSPRDIPLIRQSSLSEFTIPFLPYNKNGDELASEKLDFQKKASAYVEGCLVPLGALAPTSDDANILSNCQKLVLDYWKSTQEELKNSCGKYLLDKAAGVLDYAKISGSPPVDPEKNKIVNNTQTNKPAIPALTSGANASTGTTGAVKKGQ
jgi:hypothetical protein